MQLRDPDVLVMRLSALTLSQQAHQREEGFVLTQASKVQSTVGKTWHQEPEAAGHIVSAIRKQRTMNVTAQFECPPGPWPMEWSHPLLGSSYLSMI